MDPIETARRFARYAESGDPHDLAEVFDRTAPELLRLAMHLVSVESDAEDLLQATFLTAIERARRYDPRRPLMPWLCGILLNHMRKLRTPRRPVARPETVEPHPIETVQERELSAALRAALERLDTKHREPLRLRLVDGLSTLAIAARLRRSPGAVRVQIHRGLDRLRQLLPPGLATGGALALLGGRGLAAVRAEVVARAAAGPSTLITLGGLMLMKKTIAAVAVVAAAVVAWSLWPGSTVGDAVRPAAAADTTIPPKTAAAPDDPAAAIDIVTEPRRPLDERPIEVARCTLSVRVRWERDGTPAANIATRVHPQDGRHPLLYGIERRTDRDGLVLVENIAPGTVHVRLDRGVEGSVALAPGERGELELTIPRGYDVQGVVVDEVGDPVPGATIWADLPGNLSTTVVGTLRRLTTSDAMGRFTVGSLAPRSLLGARAAGYGASELHLLSRNDDGNVELRLTLSAEGVGATGVVVDPAGGPIAGAIVRFGRASRTNPMRRPDGSWVLSWDEIFVRSEPDGRFRVDGLPRGPIPVAVEAPGYARYARTVDPAEPLRIVLDRGAVVFGVVRDRDGQPIRDASVVRRQDLRLVAISSETVRTDRLGRFRLDSLQPGTVGLAVHKPTFERATVELAVKADEPVEWSPELSPMPRIRGSVLDDAGTPIPGIEVSAREARQRAPIAIGALVDAPRPAKTGIDGRFEIAAPRDVGYTLHLQEPNTPLTIACTELGVIESGTDDLSVVLDDGRRATARIRGRFADAAGDPIHASIRISWQDSWLIVGRTDPSSGAFDLGPLTPGSYSLRLEPLSDAAQPHAIDGLTLHAHQMLDLGMVAAVPGGDLLFSFELPDSESRPSITATIESPGRARSATLLSCVYGETTRRRLAAGDYVLTVFGKGLMAIVDRPVAIRAGETTRVAVELEPGVRQPIRFPVPKPSDGDLDREALVKVRRIGDRHLLVNGRFEPRDGQIVIYPTFAKGRYALEVTTNSRTYTGELTIESVEEADEPIDVELR